MKISFKVQKNLDQNQLASVLRQIAQDLNSMEEFDVLMDGSVLYLTDHGKVFMMLEEED